MSNASVVGIALARFPPPLFPRGRAGTDGGCADTLIDLLAARLKAEGVKSLRRPSFEGHDVQRSIALWEHFRSRLEPDVADGSRAR